MAVMLTQPDARGVWKNFIVHINDQNCIICFVIISSLFRVYIKDNNLRTQPKFIVFLSQLLLLFKFCHFCKAENPLVETRQVGTMAVVTSTCTNAKCSKKDVIWRSQPNMPGTKIAAGNFLLCMAILLSGSSASKVLQLFKHMGVACFSLNTFFRHQRVSISIYLINYRHEIHLSDHPGYA